MTIRTPLLLILGTAGMFLLLASTSSSSTTSPAVPKVPAARTIQYYVDPMNPAITSDRPGLAPCGMDFVPVYSGTPLTHLDSPVSHPGGNSTALTLRQSHGVAIETVQKTDHLQQWRSFGRVAPDPRNTYQLKAGSDGIIAEISSLAAGSKVKKGQALASFRAPEIKNTILGYITTVEVLRRHIDSGITNESQLTVVRDNVRQARDRLTGLGISEAQIEQIAESQSAPSLLGIYSPIDGTILQHSISKDLKFEKGHEWYSIADLSKVWVLADLSEEYLPAVENGATATVSLAASPSRTFSAKIADAKPTYDAASGTLRVRLEVDNPDMVLTPGMPVDIRFRSRPLRCLSVSSKAILNTGTKSIVFVEQSPGNFAPREVVVGRHLDRHVEILQGLSSGERIARTATFMLDSESFIGSPTASVSRSGISDPMCDTTASARRSTTRDPARTAGSVEGSRR